VEWIIKKRSQLKKNHVHSSVRKNMKKKKQQFVSVDWIKRVTTVYQITLTR
jgi:hypothetical protein